LVGLRVRHALIVRSVAKVCDMKESSPEALGCREAVLAHVHFGSLMRVATQGTCDRWAMVGSSRVREDLADNDYRCDRMVNS
jgi:hypothetical protein